MIYITVISTVVAIMFMVISFRLSNVNYEYSQTLKSYEDVILEKDEYIRTLETDKETSLKHIENIISLIPSKTSLIIEEFQQRIGRAIYSPNPTPKETWSEMKHRLLKRE